VKAAADKIRDANETARKAGIMLALSVAPNADAFGHSDDKAPRSDRSSWRAIAGQWKHPVRSLAHSVDGAADGSLSSDDRAYLARVVAARTGLSQADSEKRIDALSEQMKSSADKLRAAPKPKKPVSFSPPHCRVHGSGRCGGLVGAGMAAATVTKNSTPAI